MSTREPTLVGLDVVAVEFHLVQPAVTGGHSLGRHRAAGRMKRMGAITLGLHEKRLAVRYTCEQRSGE
jgi:hypothetical protein